MELTRSNTFEHVLFRSAESLKHQNIEGKDLKIEIKMLQSLVCKTASFWKYIYVYNYIS